MKPKQQRMNPVEALSKARAAVNAYLKSKGDLRKLLQTNIELCIAVVGPEGKYEVQFVSPGEETTFTVESLKEIAEAIAAAQEALDKEEERLAFSRVVSVTNTAMLTFHFELSNLIPVAVRVLAADLEGKTFDDYREIAFNKVEAEAQNLVNYYSEVLDFTLVKETLEAGGRICIERDVEKESK